jgi:hypothetical protein
VEWKLAGETEVLGENLPQRHFIDRKSHVTWPGSNPDLCFGKPATNRLNYMAQPRLVRISAGVSNILTREFSWYSLVSSVRCLNGVSVRPRPLPSKPFPYSSVILLFSMALPAHSGPRPVIQFRNHFLQTVWLLGRVISPSQAST